MKKTFIFILISLSLSSCGFVFYNYRGVLETEYIIPNNDKDSTMRYEIGKLIFSLSNSESFYKQYASPTFDSLYFYGPDYHDLKFKIFEDSGVTKVHFNYFAWNGNRRKPPHKDFIQLLTDSLEIKFGATQKIITDKSNEKKRD